MNITDSDHILKTRATASRTEQLLISIGGISLLIKCQDIEFLDLLRASYQWFELSGSAAYEVIVQLVPIEELALENRNQPAYPTVSKVGSGGNYIIRRVDNPFFAVVNTLSKKALVKVWNNQNCFDSFLRMLLTLVLTREGGLLLHASAVSRGERGSVFFGPSGSGKTTVARMSEDHTILTDELALIRPHNGEYLVYGTPFCGEFTPGRCNASAKLCGLYSLKQAKSNYLVSLDRIKAVVEIYRCVLFFSNDIYLLSKILDICCAISDSVPIHELHFLPNPSFWQVVNEHYRKGVA